MAPEPEPTERERITKIAILIECFVADFIVAWAAARIKDSY
jgi:hypothetical protein